MAYKGRGSSLSIANPRRSLSSFDVTPQAFFRLQHAGPCARVTGKVESMATLRCIVRAPSRRASAFSTLSIRLIE